MLSTDLLINLTSDFKAVVYLSKSASVALLFTVIFMFFSDYLCILFLLINKLYFLTITLDFPKGDSTYEIVGGETLSLGEIF